MESLNEELYSQLGKALRCQLCDELCNPSAWLYREVEDYLYAQIGYQFGWQLRFQLAEEG